MPAQIQRAAATMVPCMRNLRLRATGSRPATPSHQRGMMPKARAACQTGFSPRDWRTWATPATLRHGLSGLLRTPNGRRFCFPCGRSVGDNRLPPGDVVPFEDRAMPEEEPRKRQPKRRHQGRGGLEHYKLLPSEKHPDFRLRRREDVRRVLMWILICAAFLALLGLALSLYGSLTS